MEEYEAVFLPSFLRCVKRHPDQQTRVRDFVRRLQADPYQAGESHPLAVRGGVDLRGKRGAHISRNFVVIFMVCEECINRSFRAKGLNRCEPCPERPEKRLVLIAFGPHQVAYGHEWGA